jgi:hypothetical protein
MISCRYTTSRRWRPRPPCTASGPPRPHRPHRPHRPAPLQDLLAALLLSECVYKAVDEGPAAALRALTQLLAQFPPGAVELTAAEFCSRRVGHRWGPHIARCCHPRSPAIKPSTPQSTIGPSSTLPRFDAAVFNFSFPQVHAGPRRRRAGLLLLGHQAAARPGGGRPAGAAGAVGGRRRRRARRLPLTRRGRPRGEPLRPRPPPGTATGALRVRGARGRCSTLRMWGRLGRPRTPGTNLGRNGVCAANLAVGLHPDRARRPPSTAGTAWAARWPRW